MMMERMGTKPEDYDYVIFHQPNGKFPTRAAKMLFMQGVQFGSIIPIMFKANIVVYTIIEKY